MTNKRWEELGLTRRDFLRKLAVAGFVAPVVVSFSLDAVAEAGVRTTLGPNSTVPISTTRHPRPSTTPMPTTTCKTTTPKPTTTRSTTTPKPTTTCKTTTPKPTTTCKATPPKPTTTRRRNKF